MKKPLARHILLDLYNCRAVDLSNSLAISAALESVAVAAGVESLRCETVEVDGNVHLLAESNGICVCIHAYPDMKFAAVDIYSATENPLLTKLRSAMRKQFRAEKTRITNMKRGDFGVQKDVKPKTRTKGVAGRRVREAGGKLAKYIKKSTPRIRIPGVSKKKPGRE